MQVTCIQKNVLWLRCVYEECDIHVVRTMCYTAACVVATATGSI